MKNILAAALIAFASPVTACDAIIAHGLSWHSDRDFITDVNEFNPGLACRIDVDTTVIKSAEAGFFQNSYGDWSTYASASTASEGFGFFVSIATGYEKDVGAAERGGIMPAAGIQYTSGPVTMRLAGPTIGADGEKGIVAAVSFEVWGR